MTIATKFKRHSIEHYTGQDLKGYLVLDAETGTEYGFVYKHTHMRSVRGSNNLQSHVRADTRWYFQVTRGERGYSKINKDGDGWDRANATERLLEKIARAL